jgi:hypothetical protein
VCAGIDARGRPRPSASFFKIRSHPELVELLYQVFDSLPARLNEATGRDPRPSNALMAEFTILDLTATFARGQHSQLVRSTSVKEPAEADAA